MEKDYLSSFLLIFIPLLCCSPVLAADEADRATHQSDHAEDADIIQLEPIHIHGLPLNKDQQAGPVPKFTPWPTIPHSLEGQPLDDWMKARFVVNKDAAVTVVVLEPCRHRELTLAGLSALQRWTFDPQLNGDEPVDGELTVRIHFRSE
jgi:hypothetical protein